MRILLIYPPLGLDKKLLPITGDVPPLGLMDIGTQLLHKGHDIKILDASVNRYDTQKTVSEAISYNPELIGISSTSPNYKFTKKIVTELKKITNVPIIIGGLHATSMTLQCVQSGLFDYVISGEADESFPKFIDAIIRNKSKNIPGVNYKVKNRTVINQPKRPKDLKKLRMRSWDLVEIKKYTPSPASYCKLPAVSTMISRGCPNHKCIFCASKCAFGEKYRYYSLDQIRQELTYFKEKGIKDINFVDINFTTNRDHTIAVSSLLGEFGFEWSITTRCDFVDPDLLKIMAKNGCYQIGYGIEVGTQKELYMIKKDYTIKGIKKAVNDTKKAGITVKCFFSIGYPWQKEKDIQKTIGFAKELNPDVVTFSIINPYPGTELFRREKKRLNTDFDTMHHRSAANTVSRFLDEKQLVKLMNDAYRQLYFRPSFVFKNLKQLRTLTGLSNVFKSIKFIINK